jgi:hypothetical protein
MDLKSRGGSSIDGPPRIVFCKGIYNFEILM